MELLLATHSGFFAATLLENELQVVRQGLNGRLVTSLIAREGVILERQMQLTRWTDGSYHLWMGRRKRVGRGEGSSGLRYDFTEDF